MAWLGSTTTGKWLSSLSSGTAEISRVLRVMVSKVRNPRSHRDHSGLPCETMYSAERRNSLIVAASPRFSRTGLSAAESLEQREVLHIARADLKDVGSTRRPESPLGRHDFGTDLSPVSSRASASSFRPSSSRPWKS